MSRTSLKPIESFEFTSGATIARKYRVVSKLGAGWEGEVFMVQERSTGIERAAKLFFPQRNQRQKASTVYARRVHRLRECPIIIPYHVQEEIIYKGQRVTCMVSDFVEGELLTDFLKRQPGKRISVFQGVHLLYALVLGIEQIHAHHEYHGDLHSDNVIIRRVGLGFDLKVLDLFNWGHANAQARLDDLVDVIKLFHEAIGGPRHYKNQPKEVKFICCGLKRSIIQKRFKNAAGLRQHLETMHWS